MAGSTQAINIVLDGPPDLTAGSGRFVEVETHDGHSIAVGGLDPTVRRLRVPADRRRALPQQPSTTTRPDEAANGDSTP